MPWFFNLAFQTLQVLSSAHFIVLPSPAQYLCSSLRGPAMVCECTDSLGPRLPFRNAVMLACRFLCHASLFPAVIL